MKSILYDWGGLNVWLFEKINGIHNPALDSFMLLGTQLAEHGNFVLYLGLLSLVAVLAVRGEREKSLPLWFSVIVVFALSNLLDGYLVGLLKNWFAFPRPPLALPPGSVHLVGSPELSLQHSLPSGHTSFAMLLAASLWPVLKPYAKFTALLFVVWVGVSRISLGAHFPADVVAGALSCWLVVWLTRKTIQHLQRP